MRTAGNTRPNSPDSERGRNCDVSRSNRMKYGISVRTGGQKLRSAAGKSRKVDTECVRREHSMDDDDYQRIADYESEIYNLKNQQSDDEEQDESVSDQQSSSGSDLEESNSPSSLANDIVKDTAANG